MLDGALPVFDLDAEIKRVCDSVPRGALLESFQRKLAALELQIEEHRSAAAAAKREEDAGRARVALGKALAEHSQMMLAARPHREDFYVRRAARLAPLWVRGVDAAAAILDGAGSAHWGDVLIGLRPILDALNRVGRAVSIWGEKPRIHFDAADEHRCRSAIARHRSRP